MKFLPSPEWRLLLSIWGLQPLRTAAIVSRDTRSLLTGATYTLDPRLTAEVACPQLLSDMVSLSLCLVTVAVISKSQLLKQATDFMLFFGQQTLYFWVSVQGSICLSFVWTVDMHGGHSSSGHI